MENVATPVFGISLSGELGKISRILATCVPRKVAKLDALLPMIPALTPEDLCLDIGTAHGGLSSFYATRGCWTYLDVDSSNLEVAKTHLKGTFSTELAEDYLRTNSNLSLVCLVDTIPYIKDYKTLFSDIHRSLKCDGFFLVTGMESPRDPILWFRRLAGLERAIGLSINPSSRDIRTQLASAGMEIVSVKRYYGLFSQCLQTALDMIIRDRSSEGDQLTLNAATLTEKKKRKIYLFASILRFLSHLTLWMDRLLPFSPKYAWIILARKAATT